MAAIESPSSDDTIWLGEYLSVTTANGATYALWGDTRNTVTEPVNALDPLSGVTHPQQDVFLQKLKAQ